ncbi:hypothetical protein FZC74_16695 [Sutcliffiella horikoshii]|uniref:Uncharacterized protein n=1 Tax=Sutcliffiella horikoshii TaxID=79883 RepID=A0AA95B4U2_9BACI|nr:hypothetical protein [Sutcliffiella horikoshii]TYS57329.1 hypothetical protein FZC74_16695 [Sutcliffiella horikoshii]
MKTYTREIIIIALIIIIWSLIYIIIESNININLIGFFQIVATGGTLLAAIAAWKSATAAEASSEITSEQLEEMKQQRLEQKKPEIYISDSTHLLRYDFKKGYGNFVYKDKLPEIIVNNVGVGNARRIDFNWTFELNESIEIIKEYDIGKYIYRYIPNKYLGTENGVTFLDSEKNEYIPFLLKDHTFQLKIPFSYQEILSFFAHLYLEEYVSPSVFPVLKLDVQFRDVFGNLIEKSFIIKPLLLNCSSNKEDKKFVSYEIHFKFLVDELP